MITVDSTLQDIMKMDYTSREILLEVLQKRQIEASRDEMAKNAKKSLSDYRSGTITPLSFDEALRQLND